MSALSMVNQQEPKKTLSSRNYATKTNVARNKNTWSWPRKKITHESLKPYERHWLTVRHDSIL